jgi:8-oxo-dGTP pyrophosphatase MutT (NUDIX family)
VEIDMPEHVREVFQGKVIRLSVERVRLPNGQLAELEIAHHPGGAAVVAIDAQSRVCLLRQYRHAAGGWVDELPAGKLDGGEAPLACAQRELAEEAGMHAGHWTTLGPFFTSPGVLTEVIHLFLARGLTPVKARPEAHEVIEPRWLPLTEALELATTARLMDGKSIVGLVWADHVLRAAQTSAPTDGVRGENT